MWSDDQIQIGKVVFEPRRRVEGGDEQMSGPFQKSAICASADFGIDDIHTFVIALYTRFANISSRLTTIEPFGRHEMVAVTDRREIMEGAIIGGPGLPDDFHQARSSQPIEPGKGMNMEDLPAATSRGNRKGAQEIW